MLLIVALLHFDTDLLSRSQEADISLALLYATIVVLSPSTPEKMPCHFASLAFMHDYLPTEDTRDSRFPSFARGIHRLPASAL